MLSLAISRRMLSGCLVAALAALAVWAGVCPGVAPGVQLPDDRAYELVSPPQKNGGEVVANTSRTRAAADGGALMFSSLTAFDDAIGTGVATEYLSVRGGPGWVTHAITPRQESQGAEALVFGAEPRYIGHFSQNLERAAFQAWSPLTDAPMVANTSNLYVRDDVREAGEGTYTLLSDCPICVSPISLLSRTAIPAFAGATEGFGNVIFESTLNLARGASGSNKKLYESDHGTLRLAGILPTGAAATRSIAGRGVSVQALSLRVTARPISTDGSRIVFTTPATASAVNGPIYQRIAGRTTVQLNATERTTPRAAQPATYWDMSSDASRVFFTSTEALTDDAPDTVGKLYMWERQPGAETQSVAVSATGGTFTLRFGSATTSAISFDATASAVESALASLVTVGSGNVSVTGGPGDAAGSRPYVVSFVGDFAGVNVAPMTAARALTGGASTATVTTTRPLRNIRFLSLDGRGDDTGNVQGVIGAGDDGRYVYFAATGQLVSGGPTLGVSVGLYAWHEGALRYIGTSVQYNGDRAVMLDGLQVGLLLKQARVTPDGRTVLFNATSGDGLLSVRGGTDYDHGSTCSGGLGGLCQELYVYSPDSDSLRCASCNPTGAAATANAETALRAASGGAASGTYVNRAISDDGRFVFFSTKEALVIDDVNRRSDAYVYDVEQGRPHLLSTGTHPSDSYFLDASANGNDAFFATREKLVGWDVDDAYDVYDARVGGGFPEPLLAPPGCVGDACQGPGAGTPGAGAIGSGAYRGAGNATKDDAVVRPARRARGCRRGKVKKRVRGRVRCVRRASRAKRGTRASTKRRAR